jgi:hypothetical protein
MFNRKSIYLISLLIMAPSSSVLAGDWHNKVYKFPSNATNWGGWTGWKFCPVGMYVEGANLKVEGRQGRGDDTSLNRVSLRCAPKDKTQTSSITPGGAGGWGSWGATKICPGYAFVTSFNAKNESRQGRGDDTAMNDLIFRCSNNHTLFSSNGGPWGNWNGTLNGGSTQGEVRRVCGIQIQIEPNQGRGDDTAANNVGLAFCGY